MNNDKPVATIPPTFGNNEEVYDECDEEATDV